MKKLVLILILSLLYCFSVEAKYVYPKDTKTATERRVDRRFKNYVKEGEDGFSLEEYKKFREVRTVDERQKERRAKHLGTYVSPEEAFKLMDKDGDGIVTKEEMLEYEKSLIKNK